MEYLWRISTLRRAAAILFAMVLLGTFCLSCTTTFFTRAFQLCDPGRCDKPESAADAAFEQFTESAGWKLYVHVLAIYETSDPADVNSRLYDIKLQQRKASKLAGGLSFDSLEIVFPSTNERHPLELVRKVTDSGYYVPQVRRTYQYGYLAIPPDIDSIRVDFTVVADSSKSTTPSRKRMSLTMIPFEGSWEKLGIYPKD